MSIIERTAINGETLRLQPSDLGYLIGLDFLAEWQTRSADGLELRYNKNGIAIAREQDENWYFARDWDLTAPPPSAPAKDSPNTKHDVLNLAIEATRDRGLNYGAPEDNFARIAAHWTTFMLNSGLLNKMTAQNFAFRPTDVAQMMVLMKIARLENSPTHMDSWIDVAGYAACGGELAALSSVKQKI